MIEEGRRSVAKQLFRLAIYGSILAAAYSLFDGAVNGASLGRWIASIAVLGVLVPFVISAIRLRRLPLAEREARLEAMSARVVSSNSEVARYKRLHDSTKYKAAVLRDGVEGTAVIVAIGEGGRTSEHRTLVGLELEVRLPARSHYEVETGEWITAMSAGTVSPGRELVVRVDREDPDRVAVDWDASLRLR